MTQEEATTLANDYNTGLGEGVGTVKYKVFAYWLPNFVKDYNIVLIPQKYETQFNSATESQAIAFQRVSVQSLNSTVDALATFVTNFDTNGAEDSELAAYLSL